MDVGTLKAIISNRFRILDDYRRNVLLPILSQEENNAESTLREKIKAARAWLVRDRSLVPADAQKQLSKLFELRSNLQLVYQFRERLTTLWEKTTLSHKELVEALQEWCRQAEATGLPHLKEFSRYLKTFAPAPALVAQ